jgi:hypothetical protein
MASPAFNRVAKILIERGSAQLRRGFVFSAFRLGFIGFFGCIIFPLLSERLVLELDPTRTFAGLELSPIAPFPG